MKNNILIVAAHPDDEVLGVGGTLIKHIKNGDQASVLVLSDGETSKDTKIDIQKRQNQAKKVSKLFGLSELIMKKLPDQKFDTIPLLDINKQIEEVVKKIKPDIVYTHCPTDLNLDHQITCQSVMTACRPQPGFSVKKILAFETLSSTEWQIKDKANIFCPTEYVDITNFIDKKIEILKEYPDELRDFPHPRSIKGVEILAKYRGMEVGYNYAEAFQIIRLLND